jgi:hypothetical protein
LHSLIGGPSRGSDVDITISRDVFQYSQHSQVSSKKLNQQHLETHAIAYSHMQCKQHTHWSCPLVGRGQRESVRPPWSMSASRAATALLDRAMMLRGRASCSSGSLLKMPSLPLSLPLLPMLPRGSGSCNESGKPQTAHLHDMLPPRWLFGHASFIRIYTKIPIQYSK